MKSKIIKVRLDMLNVGGKELEKALNEGFIIIDKTVFDKTILFVVMKYY